MYLGFKSSFLYCFFSVIFGKVSFGVITAPVVQTLDSAIHRLKIYPVDHATGFPNVYPLDSDLSGGSRYPTFEQPGQDV